MAQYNLEFIGEADTGVKLVLEVDDFYGQRFNVNAFRGPHANMKGHVRLFDAGGSEIFTKRIQVNSTATKIVSSKYYGAGHPYPRNWYQERFGALYAIFLDKAMTAAFPEKDVPDAISFRVKY